MVVKGGRGRGRGGDKMEKGPEEFVRRVSEREGG